MENETLDIATKQALYHLYNAGYELMEAFKILNPLASQSLPHYRDYDDISDAIDEIISRIQKYQKERGLFDSND